MTDFSIIVPSYNQDKYIEETLKNLKDLKAAAQKNNITIQIILVDNCSNQETINIINNFKDSIDLLFTEKDKGQYDAINKGLKVVSGKYWTWLNTDDLLDIKGFLSLADYVKQHEADYIYGAVTYIDSESKFIKSSVSGELSLTQLTQRDASISQPGSFFRTAFTNEIGELAPFHFAFDYEYILRCLKNKARIVNLKDINLSFFRYYSNSKSGSKDFRFLKEQLEISKLYGGKFFRKLGLSLRLRIAKRKLLN